MDVDPPGFKKLIVRCPGATSPPIAAEPGFVHLQAGTRVDLASGAVVAGDGTLQALSVYRNRMLADPSEEVLVTCALSRRGEERVLGRRPVASLEEAEIVLPAARVAALSDVSEDRAIVVLDGERALVLDLLTLELQLEIARPGILSAHSALRCDEIWLHVEARDGCPAALLLRAEDGAERLILPLPDGARLVPGWDDLAVLTPGASAERLVLARRRVDSDYELWTMRLRDKAAAVAHGFAMVPIAIGSAVAMPGIMGWVFWTLSEERGPNTADAATRQWLKHRTKQARRELPIVVDAIGPLPEPGTCWGAMPQPGPEGGTAR